MTLDKPRISLLKNPVDRAEERARIRNNLINLSFLAVGVIRLIQRETKKEIDLNTCLKMVYSEEVGALYWKTLIGWNEEGYTVRKNEKPFYIWGREFDSVETKSDYVQPITKNLKERLKYTSMIAIYNESQVIPIDSA